MTIKQAIDLVLTKEVIQLVLTALIFAGLLLLVSFVFHRSFELAMKAIKLGLKGEFSTVTGQLNLVSMILVVYLLMFTSVHELVIKAMSVDHTIPQEKSLSPIVLILLFFFGSVLLVTILEFRNPKK
jgi:hypothetical protein